MTSALSRSEGIVKNWYDGVYKNGELNEGLGLWGVADVSFEPYLIGRKKVKKSQLNEQRAQALSALIIPVIQISFSAKCVCSQVFAKQMD